MLSHPKTPRVKRIAANLLGRDFVIGDIHGAYKSVQAAMRAARFDEDIDRLFSVGDLIDRGPDSAVCVPFLGLPFVFAIQGNHEAMLLELYREGEPSAAVLQEAARHNGFGWWLDTSSAQRQEVLAAIQELPNVIELETARGTVGLVHGDIPAGMDWPTFVREIEAGNPLVLEISLWGRQRIAAIDGRGNVVNKGHPDRSGVSGVGRVFVGHTAQWNGPTRYGNVYAIDTGAVFGEKGLKSEGRLTAANAICTTGILVEQRRPGLIDVRDHVVGGPLTELPFGAYASLPKLEGPLGRRS